MNEQPKKLDTHFIKNDDFKTVYGSGFYGGFTPSGHLNVLVYTERVPVPNRISYQVDQSDNEIVLTGKEVEREGKSGVVREVQFGVLFDVATAESLIDWLQGKVDEYNQAKAKLSQ